MAWCRSLSLQTPTFRTTLKQPLAFKRQQPFRSTPLPACPLKRSSRLRGPAQIDDPLNAVPMHGAVGAWALLFVGLLAKREYVREAYGRDDAFG